MNNEKHPITKVWKENISPTMVQTRGFSADPDRCQRILTWYSRPRSLAHQLTGTSCLTPCCMPHLLPCLEEKWMAAGGLWRGSDAFEKSNEHYNTRNKKKNGDFSVE